MSASRTNLQDRYELGEILGKGGMGVVYRARDTLMDREVALKTLLDIDSPVTLELFYKECGVLAGMVHPNIINVYDVGEFEENGVKKPFFVMPLLPGATLDKLIRDTSRNFALDTLIEIFSQACRGLHAAHEMGLVHRDVKPSNIFVMDDNSVKIIDFGIARSTSMGSMTSLKGTLSYMSPEQLQLKTPTPLSDQYSMAVVCYEALTRRRPFQGNTETEVAEAILHQSPPPISYLNPNVRYAISQVIHKGMAKQPFHRFLNMREFADALVRAARAENLEFFDAEKIRPRLQRANEAFDRGDFEFAGEVLSELEAEGYLEQDITLLRRRIDQSLRQNRVRQLLSSASRYAEADEYPLALRKIQEALEIDPQHPDALALKNRVEKGRREKKIDEWVQLARQHMQNQAFDQARAALDNALKVKPNETEALRLLAEISRREEDLSKIREKKAATYESAVQAWERGDVTAALSRLDILLSLERQTPDTDSGRSGTYQSFYNQVRSEHDTLKNSYDEARSKLAADDFQGALAVCKQYLNKYPNHALFQSLEFDIEERQRQKLSALIAETDRRVDQEPDLAVRVAILEEAARMYPTEKHFKSSLRLVKDKRDLVQSIVGKAQMYEERQQYNEALDQWQIIRSIHAAQPGLDFEIERVRKRRDAQARQAGLAAAIEKLDHYIETGEYDRARAELAEARAEFANAAEFAEIEKLIEKSEERATKAQDLFNRARELADANQMEEALRLLREAHQIDGGNLVIRAVLVNTLLEHGGKLVNQDYAAAEPVLQEVLQMEPGQAAAQSLLNQVADRKRENFVSGCATEARRLQVAGNLDGALARVKAALEKYPEDRLLRQLQTTLQRAQGGPDSTAGTATAPRQMPSASFMRKPATTDDLPTVSYDAQTMTLGAAAPPSPAPPPSDATATIFQAPGPPPGADSPEVAAASTSAVETPSAPQEPAPTPPAPPAPPATKHGFPMKAVGGAAAAVLVLGAGFFFTRGKHVTPAPGQSVVSFEASQPQATILVDNQACGTGKCESSLAPGQHRAEARLDGYNPASATFEIRKGAGVPPVSLALTPRLPAVIISTNLNQAMVGVDQGSDQPVQNGELQLPELAAGTRTIRFRGEGGEASISVTAAPAAAPAINLPIKQQNLSATVVTGLGGAAKIVTTLPNAEATLDGKPAGKVGASGLDLTNLTPGSHEVVVTAAKANPQRVVFDSGAVPSMSVFLGAERNVGMLLISTGEDDVSVYVNGEKSRRTTQRGRLILNLEPKTYKIRVEKQGFQPIAEQTVDVTKGEEARLEFQMQRIPTVGSLMLQKAPAGAEVQIDGTAAGAVRPDGTLPIPSLKPGNHAISVHKEHFRTLTREVNVIAGQQTEVDATLQAATGTVKITIAPPEAAPALSWKREGEENSQNFTENPLTLPEGSYIIAGHAAEYEDAHTTAKVVSGQQASAVLVFKRIAKKEAPKRGFTLADVEKTGGWTSENGSLGRLGGNVVALPLGSAPGTYAFTALMQKGKRLDWMINYVDPKNYVSYELSGDNLTRTEYVDGKKQNGAKQKVQVKLDQWIQITVEVTNNSIVTGIQQQPGGGSYPGIDKFTREGPSLTAASSFLRGKFAFRIPGKDRLALGAFSFTAK